jgi:uncharacterized damage-inducible protein DinB
MQGQYPIGKFEAVERVDAGRIAGWIDDIAAAPERLAVAVRGFDESRLATPYREGGWTVRQVVHHVPDSHMNAYVRYRLALTEDEPTVKGYEEDRWAELADARGARIETSLALLAALHERWVVLLRSLSAKDFERGFVQPQTGRRMSLGQTLALYSWHGRHHTAQITSLAERRGWR